jgi:hypothetical protein
MKQCIYIGNNEQSQGSGKSRGSYSKPEYNRYIKHQTVQWRSQYLGLTIDSVTNNFSELTRPLSRQMAVGAPISATLIERQIIEKLVMAVNRTNPLAPITRTQRFAPSSHSRIDGQNTLLKTALNLLPHFNTVVARAGKNIDWVNLCLRPRQQAFNAVTSGLNYTHGVAPLGSAISLNSKSTGPGVFRQIIRTPQDNNTFYITVGQGKGYPVNGPDPETRQRSDSNIRSSHSSQGGYQRIPKNPGIWNALFPTNATANKLQSTTKHILPTKLTPG